MLYFIKTAISQKKHLDKGLQSIYGIGEKKAKSLVLRHGIIHTAKGKDLRNFHRLLLRSSFEDSAKKLGADLKQAYRISCQRLIKNLSYRGRRHRAGYPVRGQRTHTNAKTQEKLHKRWSMFNYEKPKITVYKKTGILNKKLAKPKKALPKAKLGQKAKAKIAKTSKYKI